MNTGVGGVTLCLVIAAVSALVHLRAEYRGPRWVTYVAKPLTTIMLTMAAGIATAADPTYRTLVVVGLLFSLAGDIFLMLPTDRFVLGLASFLVAHVVYVQAFSIHVGFGSQPLLLLPYLGAAAVVMTVLWNKLGKLRLAVIVYVIALVAMAWQATSRAAELGSEDAIAAAVGAALFVVSDATLAINRFKRSFPAAQAIVMSTYVAAQALIAWSVSRSAG